MELIKFEGSNLQYTINTVNDKEGLNRYRYHTELAVKHWQNEKLNEHPNADENIKFFNEALELINKKLSKIK